MRACDSSACPFYPHWLSLSPTMAKRLHGTIFPSLLQLHAAPRKTSLAPTRALSTIQKMPEPCDLFEYTTGRWMYVAGQHLLLVELLD